MPLLGAFAVRERGVQNGDFITENLMQVGGNRRSQTDFRNEEDGGASRFEHGAHAGQIDGCLTRPGDTVQQHAGKLAG